MESPLDILSRAAGMVSGSSTNSSPVPSDVTTGGGGGATATAVVLVGGQSSSQVNMNSMKEEGLPMRLVSSNTNNKRKFADEGRGGGSTSSVEDDVEVGGGGIPVMNSNSSSSSVILKKALVTTAQQQQPPLLKSTSVVDGFGGRQEAIVGGGGLGVGRSALPFFKSTVGPAANTSVMAKQRVNVHVDVGEGPFEDFEEEDCQPLDMSCKKKRSSSPDTNSPPILPYQLPLRQAPPPPLPLPQSSSSFNGVHHKKKWSAVLNNGDNSSNHSLNEGNLNPLGKMESNNGGTTTTTSEGSGTDLRRPSVIYYATQTPGTENTNTNGIPQLPVGSSPANLPLISSATGPLVVSSGGGGSGGGGGGGKARRRYLHQLHNQRHPSGSSSSSSSEMLPLPPRRKHVKRKKKQRDNNLLGLSLGGLHNMTREELLDVESSQRRIVVITSKEDDIDEHFRRSLGDRYDKCYSKKDEETTNNSSHNIKPLVLSSANIKAEGSIPTSSSPSSPTTQQIIQPPPVTTINNIAAKAPSHSNSPVNVRRENSPPTAAAAADLDMSFSVDDHFAKALGSETWSRISKGSNSVKSEEVDEGGTGSGAPDSRRSSCSLSSLPEKA